MIRRASFVAGHLLTGPTGPSVIGVQASSPRRSIMVNLSDLSVSMRWVAGLQIVGVLHLRLGRHARVLPTRPPRTGSARPFHMARHKLFHRGVMIIKQLSEKIAQLGLFPLEHA
jgi:hypothetical protein